MPARGGEKCSFDHHQSPPTMRIAVNARFLLPRKLEGIGWFSHEVIRRLVARRPQDEFLLFFDRPYDARFVYADNVVPIVVPPPARHPVLWYAWFELALPRRLAAAGADIFLSCDGYCSLRSSVPTVMVLHDIAHVHYPLQLPRLVRRYYYKYVPRFLERAERIVTVSDFVRQDIQRYYGTPAAKLRVAGNGVRDRFVPTSADTRLDTRARYAQGQPYFFYIGAIHPRKNVPQLIRAYDLFRQWTGQPVKLLVAGRLAWRTREVREAHRAAHYRDDIIFLDYVPDEDLPALLGSALALVYVSLFEGFGVPLLEAMHCEVPIITSNTSSLPEVAGDAALLVDPTRAGAIAEAMSNLYRNPRLAAELVARGRQQRERFTWDRVTDIVEATLLELAPTYP